MSRWTSLALALVAAALCAATCNKRRGDGPAKTTTAPTSATSTSPAVDGGGGSKESVQTVSESTPTDLSDLSDLVSKLSSAAQREFRSVLTDEFCYCGCPHSIGACLKGHRTCKHAQRMAAIAAAEAETGAPSVEISVSLSKYYLSFRERRQSFRVDARLCQGAQNAKVTLMEFSDFECPYCAAARSTLEEFARQNASTVRFCFAPFPLTMHPHALPAAQLALLARDRGKFWQIHDLLFENQTRLNDDVFRELGQKVGLSGKDISAALESGAYRDELKASQEAGKSAGVDATPTVYINGRKLTLSLKASTLKQTLEDELEWTAHNNAWAAD